MINIPMPFKQAITYLLEKKPNPQEWDSKDWSGQEASVKVRSFFSANVESARFLDRAQGLLFDFMVGTTEEVTSPNGTKHTLRRISSRSEFVSKMREFMISEGMVKEGDFADVKRTDLTDIRSSARLNLIFDTNIRQAYAYGKWRQGMSPAVRKAFPAARFIRVRGVAETRPRHAAHTGEVRLKTDYDWWAKFQNDPLIGGFGVPWGPYGFGSGMDQEDVSKEESNKSGITAPGAPLPPLPPPETVKPTPAAPDPPTAPLPSPKSEPSSPPLPGLNTGLSAAIGKMSPEMKAALRAELQGQIDKSKLRRPIEDVALENGLRARKGALQRSQDKALAKGDHAEVERIQKFIDAEPEYVPWKAPAIREEGDRLHLDE